LGFRVQVFASAEEFLRSPVEIARPDLETITPPRWEKARPVPGRKDRPLAHPVGEEDSQLRQTVLNAYCL
jgi:hypothetical protein